MARKSKAEKMSKQKDDEMEMLLSEQEDPVSGNIAPLGAKPEEVRDDVEINVSPNEFVINAATVRYFGEDFFRELQDTAAEGWERIKEGTESPFRDDELETVEEGEPKEGFAEGGPVPKPVGGGYGGYGGRGATFTGFESKTFVNPETGQEMVVFFFMGRPLSRLPNGFIEKGSAPVEQASGSFVRQPVKDEGYTGIKGEIEDTWRNKSINEWDLTDFENYRTDMGTKETPGEMSFVEKGILGFVGNVIGGPAGAIALQELAKKSVKKQAEAVSQKAIDIISTGTNPSTGEKLAPNDLDILNRAKIEADFVAFEQSKPGMIQSALGVEAPVGMNTGVPLYEQQGYFGDTTIGDVSVTQSQASDIYKSPGKDDSGNIIPGGGALLAQQSSGVKGSEDAGKGYGVTTFVDVDPNLDVTALLPTSSDVTAGIAAANKSLRGDTSPAATQPTKTTTAQEVKAAEDKASAATNKWAAATAAVNSISPSDDPVAWHNAIQAQSQASREATAAIKEATAAKNNDDDSSNDSPDSGCFLTTAIVELRGEADDGPTLTKLRAFRDTYLRSKEGEVQEYYRVAPKIVSAIPKDHEDWVWVGQQIDKAIEYIDSNLKDKAYVTYKNMVKKLETDWL